MLANVMKKCFLPIRYISIEELEQALKEFGMGSDKDIKEIVSEVDSDNVRNRSPSNMNSIC